MSQITFVSRLCSSKGVCTCVVSQFPIVSNLCSLMGVCTCVVNQFALVSRLHSSDGSVYLCCESVSHS